MDLSLSITLGDLVQGAMAIVTLVAVYVRLSERLVVLETKVDAMWDRRQRPRE